MKRRGVMILTCLILLGVLSSCGSDQGSDLESDKSDSWTFVGDEYYTKVKVDTEISILLKVLQDRDYQAIREELEKGGGPHDELIEVRARAITLDRAGTVNDIESQTFDVQIPTPRGLETVRMQKISAGENFIIMPKSTAGISMGFVITPDGKRSILASEIGMWQIDGASGELIKLSVDTYNGRTMDELQKESIKINERNDIFWNENIVPSPDSSKLAYSSNKHGARANSAALFVYDFETKTEAMIAEMHGTSYMTIGWLDSQHIVCERFQKDATVRSVVNLEGDEVVLDLKGESPFIYSVRNGLIAYAPMLSGTEIYIASFDGNATPVEIYNSWMSEAGTRLRDSNGLSPDASHFACIYYSDDTEDRVVKVIDLERKREFTIDSLPEACDPSSYILEFNWLDNNRLMIILTKQSGAMSQESTWVYDMTL